MRGPRYAILPPALFEDDALTVIAIRVAGVLGSMTDNNGWCFPSQQQIAERINSTRETVNRALKLLEERGWVERHNRRAQSGAQIASLYRIRIDRPDTEPCDDEITPPVTEPSLPCDDTITDPVIPSVTPPVTPAITPNERPQFNDQISSLRSDMSDKPKATHGSRLPEDWSLPSDWWNDASKIGLRAGEIDEQEARFRDYWRAVPGAKGRKADWRATWRNWCRTAMERKHGNGRSATGSGPEPRGFDAALAVARDIATGR